MTNWQRSERQPALVAHPPAASLDEAHLAIDLWEFYSRKILDAEQRLAVELMMAESEDGRWAADTTGRAESRQNGKGDEIEVVELWGLTQRGEAILHTAHEAATAASAHERLVSLVEGHRDLSRKVRKKQSWNGNYSLRLTNDAVIVWRTRTGAGGRGLDDISRIVVDEAQHAQPEELASSLPILSVNPNPQKNFLGSGGVAGKSEFWWRMRRRAFQAPGRFSWLEHSAETVTLDGSGKIVSVVGDVADPAVWRRANPAYPSRISHDFLRDQLETLGPDLFAREHLCVWDPEPVGSGVSVIPAESWRVCADAARKSSGSLRFSLDVDTNSDGVTWATIGRSDGTLVEVVQSQPGTAWVVDVCLAKKSVIGDLLVVRDSPAAALLADLEKADVPVQVVSPGEFAQASMQFLDAVLEGTLRHLDQPELNTAVAKAVRKDMGDGQWRWSRKLSPADIGPLCCLSVARWAQVKKSPPVFAY